MKLWKINLLMLAGMLVLFAASSCVNYYSAASYLGQENLSQKTHFLNLIQDNFSADPAGIMQAINGSESSGSVGAVILDEKGQPVESRGISLAINTPVEGEGYLTEEYNIGFDVLAQSRVEIKEAYMPDADTTCEKIYTFMNEFAWVNDTSKTQMTLTYNLTEQDKLEPVTLSVENSENGASMLVTFSDDEALYSLDYQLISNEDMAVSTLQWDWYNLGETDVEKCLDNQNFLEENYKSRNMGLETSSNKNGEWIDSYIWTGENAGYYLLVGERAPLVSDIVKSSLFLHAELMQLVFYIVLYLILCLIVSRLVRRSRRLENSRKAFISAAGHELKTPIAIIQNQCECVLEDVNPEKNKDYVQSIFEETDRMNHLVVTMLQYNKLMAAEKIEKNAFNLSQTLGEEIDKYRPLFAQKQIELNATVMENFLYVGNEQLLTLVIDNFLSNAVKYTPEQGHVEIRLEKSGKTSCLRVENTCESLSPDQLAHIWEPLYRTDEARSGDGASTGMGLPISAEILKLHKLKYSAENTKTGLVFCVNL